MKCNTCGSRDLNRLNEAEYKCTECGTIYLSESVLKEKREDILDEKEKKKKLYFWLFICVLVITAYFTYPAVRRYFNTKVAKTHNEYGFILNNEEERQKEKSRKKSAEYKITDIERDSINSLWITGFFENTGDAMLKPYAEIWLYNKNGKKIKSGKGYGKKKCAFSKEKVPLQVLISDAPSYDSYKIIVNPEVNEWCYVRPELSFSEIFHEITYDYIDTRDYLIKGKITNNDDYHAKYIDVIVLFFDKENRLVDVDSLMLDTNQSSVRSGDTLSFQETAYGVYGKPVRFEIDYDGKIIP